MNNLQMINVFIKEKSWIAKIAATKLQSENCAIVFLNTIYLHNISKKEIINNTELFRHEVMHIKQWKREGAFIFLFKYIKFTLQFGYYNNPLEIEARKAELDANILKEILIFR
jgi:hypothetical protein